MILNQIVAEKKKEIAKAKKALPLAELVKRAAASGPLRGFKEAIAQPGKINLIAELKKASPSKGLFREDFDPVSIARAYRASGACALSIITEKKFFQGDILYLKNVRETVNLPILRKDFIVDEYQLYETIYAGADAVLLISQLLTEKELKEFLDLCTKINLDVVCEVHNEAGLDQALRQGFVIIGINNRDLHTFAQDLQITARLIKKIPKGKIIISESGIKTSADVKYLESLGVNAVLIGETLMRSKDIGAKVKELMG